IQSGLNDARWESMPVVLAEGVASVAGPAWSFFAPVIGALGAFVAGSNTVSNLTFSQCQWSTANTIGGSPEITTAAGAVGGAGCNTIPIHNIIAASATVGLLIREGDIIRKRVWVALYYSIAAGSVAYLLIHGFGFNLGTIAVIILLLALAALGYLAFRRGDSRAVKISHTYADRTDV